MEVQKRRKYSKEFKEDVLNMIKTGDKGVLAISKELDIAEAVIYRWYKKCNGITVCDEKVSQQEKELRELRSKLAEVTEERDILKKAVNIFSKQGTLK
jgi:transposase